ncbi:MAG TPA: FtsX-like permease family protein [Pyrinomonadaceae bacterium]|nr:FtsX-like permease family protein [Pyrinomonadaceae bacterium]
MPYELFLALRYLRARRGRRVARWTALAAVAGIACGVAALTVATALANGFRDELRDKILRGTAHVTLAREGGAVEDPRAVAGRVRGIEGVLDAQPTTYEGALLSGPNGAAYTLLRGLDEHSARAVSDVQSTLTKGKLDAIFQNAPGRSQNLTASKSQTNSPSESQADSPVPVVVGEELASRTGLNEVGGEGWVLTGAALNGAGGFEPRARRVRVVGVFRSGLYEYDSAWTYLSLDAVAGVVGARPSTAVVGIEARDIYASDEVARHVRAALGAGWTTLDWREANRALFDALALERRTVALIIMLVTVVAALNITTTLALVVVERRADIAVLAALGARPLGVTLVFVIEGAIVGAVGALAGVALGLAACAAAERFHLVRLPPDVYSIASVPLHPHAGDVLLAALAAFAVSLLATIYPALQAARVRPAEALRYE